MIIAKIIIIIIIIIITIIWHLKIMFNSAPTPNTLAALVLRFHLKNIRGLHLFWKYM